MNLTIPYGARDDVSNRNGDRYFIGIDERRSPQQLDEGLGSYGKNLRFRKGKAESRKGVLICPWMKGTGRTPWGEVYGGVVFSDPNQNGDWFIIAADGGVWKTRPNMTAQVVPLPSGVTLTADTFKMFVPNTDGGVGVLVLLRGPSADPLVCTNLDAGFTAVPAHTGGTRDMPRSSFGLNHINRLLLIEGKDIVAASDILAYNDFVGVQNEYRINPGDSQSLTRLLPMSNTTLLCFKTQRVLMVTGVTNGVNDVGDTVLNGVGPDVLTDSYGLAGPLAVVRKGSNCYWLTSEPSVVSLRLTEQNETQDTDIRLSDPMTTTFGRINSLYLDRACVETWDGKLYVALPLDDAGIPVNLIPANAAYTDAFSHYTSGSLMTVGKTYYLTNTSGFTVGAIVKLNGSPVQNLGSIVSGDSKQFTAAGDMLNLISAPQAGQPVVGMKLTLGSPTNATCNGVVVFDLVNQAWAGLDEAPGVFAVRAFFKTTYLGRQRLFFLGSDGTIRLYEEGFEDEIFDGAGNIVIQAVPATYRSRGFQLQDNRSAGYQRPDNARGRALSAAVLLRSWDPRYTLSTANQGYNTDAAEQSAVTRSRTTYDTYGVSDWDPANDPDDHATAGRQDYSVTLNDPTGLNLDTSGVDVDGHQISTDRIALGNIGDWQQLEVNNDQGRIELLSINLETQDHERRSGVNIV